MNQKTPGGFPTATISYSQRPLGVRPSPRPPWSFSTGQPNLPQPAFVLPCPSRSRTPLVETHLKRGGKKIHLNAIHYIIFLNISPTREAYPALPPNKSRHPAMFPILQNHCIDQTDLGTKISACVSRWNLDPSITIHTYQHAFPLESLGRY